MTRRELLYADIKYLREVEGKMWREIGEIVGVSLKTANEYYHDPTGAKTKARKAKNDGVCIDCSGTTHSGGGVIAPERCRSCQHVYLRSLEGRRELAKRPRHRKWTDEQILDAIRSAATNGVCTSAQYQAAYAKAPKGSMPSLPIIARRFGLWSTARDAAGVTGWRAGGAYSTRLSKESARLAVEECALSLGYLPTYTAYERWALENDAPSGQLIRMRWHTWMKVTESVAASLPELIPTP